MNGAIRAWVDLPAKPYDDEQARASGSYRADQQPNGRWQVIRCPDDEFSIVPFGQAHSESQARRMLDWLVAHDKLVRFCALTASRGNGSPLFSLMHKVWTLSLETTDES